MKVVIYLNWYNEKHCTILKAFAEGVPGAVVRDVREYGPCDIAVIFGGVKKSYEPTWAKQKIIDRHKDRSLIMIESAFVRRGQYWQVGFGGTAGNADFRSDGMPFDRWLGFGINGNPWQYRPDSPVIVCGQLLRDTQVQYVDHRAWCRETVDYFDKLGVPVLFRPHPRAGAEDDYTVDAKYVDIRPIDDVLNFARCFVSYNSTSAVDAIVHGVPVMVGDPSSIAWNMGVQGLAHPDSLIYPKRRPWLSGLGYSQWGLQEMRDGLPWKHLTR